jgi:hypothetical protein
VKVYELIKILESVEIESEINFTVDWEDAELNDIVLSLNDNKVKININ